MRVIEKIIRKSEPFFIFETWINLKLLFIRYDSKCWKLSQKANANGSYSPYWTWKLNNDGKFKNSKRFALPSKKINGFCNFLQFLIFLIFRKWSSQTYRRNGLCSERIFQSDILNNTNSVKPSTWKIKLKSARRTYWFYTSNWNPWQNRHNDQIL